MVLVDGLQGDAVTDDLFSSDVDLQAFFDLEGLELTAAGIGDGEEEEELEWLVDKDAFPSVETMASKPCLVEEPPATEGARRRRLPARWSLPPPLLRTGPRNPTPPPPTRPGAVGAGQCRHCGATKTPQWREGPEGRRTLCNACGIMRYRRGRLVPEYRPISSPTFSPGLHSNRHNRVAAIRLCLSSSAATASVSGK